MTEIEEDDKKEENEEVEKEDDENNTARIGGGGGGEFEVDITQNIIWEKITSLTIFILAWSIFFY